MKSSMWRRFFSSALVFTFLMAPSVSQGIYSPWELSNTMHYVIAQKEWRGDLTQLTFDYHLLISGDNEFRAGNIFVAFRLRSQPDNWWFLGQDGNWSMYTPGVTPPSYSGGILQPVTRVSILRQPADVSAFAGDGEFWVGWGFSEVSFEASFQDMLSNARCGMVWLIGSPQESDTTIFLYSTEIGVDRWDIVLSPK